MSRISDGLSPASTSSSSSSCGSVASARASSRRLRPATVSLAAGAIEEVGEADASRDRLGPRERVGAAGRAQVRADGDVLAHAQAGERLHDLEGARDAAPRQHVRRHAGDVVAAIDGCARRSAARSRR